MRASEWVNRLHPTYWSRDIPPALDWPCLYNETAQCRSSNSTGCPNWNSDTWWFLEVLQLGFCDGPCTWLSYTVHYEGVESTWHCQTRVPRKGRKFYRDCHIQHNVWVFDNVPGWQLTSFPYFHVALNVYFSISCIFCVFSHVPILVCLSYFVTPYYCSF